MSNKASATHLALTAIVASAISIGALLTYQNVSRRHQRRLLDAEIKKHIGTSSSDKNIDPPANSSEIQYEPNESIIREQLARNYAFFGEEGMACIRGSRVAVIGCGGVGSWASVMLVRSYVFFWILINSK